MATPIPEIKRLDEAVVNRIAAGEVRTRALAPSPPIPRQDSGGPRHPMFPKVPGTARAGRFPPRAPRGPPVPRVLAGREGRTRVAGKPPVRATAAARGAPPPARPSWREEDAPPAARPPPAGPPAAAPRPRAPRAPPRPPPQVIQRPANCLKELLENALDAGATQVTVQAKDGGMKSLQVTDNGHGIREADLPILCERFTTSKLRAFEDLQTVGTLGFRGEALASISFVAHLSVTTMAHGAGHALKCAYTDGAPRAPPAPCASVPGTTMLVEDLFFNMPTRRRGLKSAGEEYARILDVVSRYAVYKAGTALVCRRQGVGKPDLSTPAGGSRRAAVRAAYGAAVAADLLDLSTSAGDPADFSLPGLPSQLSLRAEGLVTGVNFAGKKTTLVLFINGRPVDCSPLKRALEGVYAAVLPKTAKPFVFLDVRVPPRAVSPAPAARAASPRPRARPPAPDPPPRRWTSTCTRPRGRWPSCSRTTSSRTWPGRWRSCWGPPTGGGPSRRPGRGGRG